MAFNAKGRVLTGMAFWVVGILAMAQTAYFPHVTRSDGGFQTSFWLANPLDHEVNYSLKAYSSSGEELASIVGFLAEDSSQFVSQEALFGEKEIAWFQLESGGALVTAVYQANGEKKTTAHVNQTTELAVRWRVYAGDPELVWDGLALVNPHDVPISFIYHAYDASGTLLGSIFPFAPLMPHAKDLNVLSDNFPQAAYYEIETQLPSLVTALRGDRNSSDRLWVSAAIPLIKDFDTVVLKRP